MKMEFKLLRLAGLTGNFLASILESFTVNFTGSWRMLHLSQLHPSTVGPSVCVCVCVCVEGDLAASLVQTLGGCEGRVLSGPVYAVAREEIGQGLRSRILQYPVSGGPDQD